MKFTAAFRRRLYLIKSGGKQMPRKELKPFDKAEWLRLEKKADELRRLTVETTVWGGSGHIGGAMSSMDFLTTLYYRFLNIDVNEPQKEDRDRFILSKGHVAVGYAPLICDYGFMDIEGLKNFNLTGSKFGMHLDCNKITGVDASSGSLGHGMSLAAGMALAGRVKGQQYMNFVLTGDGELNEGSNWEAAMTIAQFKLTNTVVAVDANKCMIDGRVDDEMKVEPIDKKFESFGFKVIRVDGHNIKEISDAIQVTIENYYNGGEVPYCIVLDTYKGAGIDFMQDDYHWHYGALNDERYKACLDSLDRYYKERVARVEKEA